MNYSILGITLLRVGESPVLLTDALRVAEDKLMGKYASSWPLTKVLDIGGTARRPKFVDKSGGATEGKDIRGLLQLTHP